MRATGKTKGSPPRVRGKPDSHALGQSPGGITPACAGKTARRLSTKRSTRDHPRVCGENCHHVAIPPLLHGSPPRVRGKLLPRVDPVVAHGDHPRVCGENCTSRPAQRPERGSPPRVRGKPRNNMYDVNLEGITPACAGKTYRVRERPDYGWDHPRVCGENNPALCLLRGRPGSPPRVRGKHLQRVSIALSVGITPACAGKTLLSPLRNPRSGDHPRVCGENTRLRPGSGTLRGSPPRVRGKRGYMDPDPHRVGITPACAGKTLCLAPHFCFRRDHPRVCGENQMRC